MRQLNNGRDICSLRAQSVLIECKTVIECCKYSLGITNTDCSTSALQAAPNLKNWEQNIRQMQTISIYVAQKAPFIPYFTTWDGQSNQSVFNVPLLGLPNLCDKDRPVPHHLVVGELTPSVCSFSCLDVHHKKDLYSWVHAQEVLVFMPTVITNGLNK